MTFRGSLALFNQRTQPPSHIDYVTARVSRDWSSWFVRRLAVTDPTSPMVSHPFHDLRPPVLERGSHLDLNQTTFGLHDDVDRAIAKRGLSTTIHHARLGEKFEESLDKLVLFDEGHVAHEAHAGDVLNPAEIHARLALELRDERLHGLESGGRPEFGEDRDNALASRGHRFIKLPPQLLKRLEVGVVDWTACAEALAQAVDRAPTEPRTRHATDGITSHSRSRPWGGRRET